MPPRRRLLERHRSCCCSSLFPTAAPPRRLLLLSFPFTSPCFVVRTQAGVQPYLLGEHRRIPAAPPLLLSSPVPHCRAAAPPLPLSSSFSRTSPRAQALFDVHVDASRCSMLDMRKEPGAYDCRRGSQLTHLMGGGTFAYVRSSSSSVSDIARPFCTSHTGERGFPRARAPARRPPRRCGCKAARGRGRRCRG